MKVCIYGIGAIGCLLAGRLAAAGAEVSAVARGANLEAIRRNGIHVEAGGDRISAKLNVSDDPSELGPQDFVIVTVKSPSLPSIADGIKGLIGPDTTVAFVMNGIPWWYFYKIGGALTDRRLETLDPDSRLWAAVDPARVIGGVIFCSCDLIEPGLVHSAAASPKLVLGEPDGTLSERAERLASAIRSSAFSVDVVSSIRGVVWSKLQSNMSSGLLGCLANAPPKDIYGDAACVHAIRQIVAETAAIARAAGYDTTVTAEDILKRGLGQAHRPSILQDLDHGRPMEIDSMFSIPLEIARMMGIETPMLDLLVSLVKIRARQAGSYAGAA
jgi:2-dehydropantoate 2-reductase